MIGRLFTSKFFVEAQFVRSYVVQWTEIMQVLADVILMGISIVKNAYDWLPRLGKEAKCSCLTDILETLSNMTQS